MSQAYYRKWRPHLWDEVVGQEHVVHTLQNAIRSGRVGHAYLFAGPRGTGKTTTARLLAKAINCLAEDPAARPCDQCEHCKAVNGGHFLDLIEIDAASNTSVDDIRDLREKINFSPSQGKFKVYIIDEVHMLSTAAFNALLKTLEEPPAHAIFILATTEMHKIPATVLSRCQRHEFRRIPVAVMLQYLRIKIDEEGLKVDEDALTLIARQATGSMRDAISLLDQLASGGETITLSYAQSVLGTATNQSVIALTSAILSSNTADGLICIHQALDAGADPRQYGRQVVDYLRALLLIHMGSADQVDATPEMRALMAEQSSAFELARLMEAVRLFNYAASERGTGWQPALALELALAESIHFAHPVDLPSTNAPAASPSGTGRDPGSFTPISQVPSASTSAEFTEKSHPVATQSPSADAEPSTQAAPPADEGNPINLAQISKAWPAIRTAVKPHSPSTEALMNSCKLLGFKNGALILGFAGEINRSKMDTPQNLDLVTQAILHITGFKLGVNCVIIKTKNSGSPDDLGVDADGMVGTALNLGGQVVHKEAKRD